MTKILLYNENVLMSFVLLILPLDFIFTNCFLYPHRFLCCRRSQVLKHEGNPSRLLHDLLYALTKTAFRILGRSFVFIEITTNENKTKNNRIDFDTSGALMFYRTRISACTAALTFHIDFISTSFAFWCIY